MGKMAVVARVYVSLIIAIGAALFVASIRSATFDQPILFAALVTLAPLPAALRVSLPLTNGGSTLSVSYAIDFAALLLLGPHETMLVAAAGAISQCHLNTKEDNPTYKTLFSIASLITTVRGAAAVFQA